MKKTPADINKLSLDLLGLYANIITDNRIWQTFGFDKRPRRGRLFNFLISKKKLALESFVIKEIFGFVFNDIKNVLITTNHFNREEADFRALVLVGLVCNAYQLNFFSSTEEILDIVRISNEYLKSEGKIVENIIKRLQEEVGLSSSEATNIFMNLHLAFGAIKKDEGVILNMQSIRNRLNYIEPIGTIKSKGLNQKQTDKIIQVTYELINNQL